MDASEVIKGIEHFFGNLLPKAYNSLNWTEDSITNAFLWAQFCEQIYQTYEKLSKKQLDELIHSIAENFKHGNQSVCFEDLNRSTTVLCEAFFENLSVENDLVKSILSKIKGYKNDFENFEDGHELNSLCVELIEALKPIKCINSDRSIYYEVKAEIYLNMLKDATCHMTSEEQVEKYLTTALEQLCESRDEMVLLHMLMHRISENLSSALAEIQEFAIHWTILKILSERYNPLGHFMWKQPSSLRAISLNSSNFLTFYLDYLTRCSKSLNSEVEDDEVKWMSWSLDGDEVLTFDEILTHFRCLLGDDDNVCESTKSHLLSLLNSQPDALIWKEIFSRVT